MSSIYYAQLDGNNVCTSVTQYEQALDNPPSNYKVIDSFDESLIGKKWDGSNWEAAPVVAETEEKARQWRDSELFRTDVLVLVPDHPNASNLIAYRSALRSWPADSENFPNTKPVLGA